MLRRHEASLRLIFDLRRGNRYWRDPPWTALSGASSLAWLDFSVARSLEGQFWISSGDVPDFFYHLGLPQEFSAWFCLDGFGVDELTKRLD